jgi:hypothetical protein
VKIDDDDPKSPGSPTGGVRSCQICVVLKSALEEHSRNFNNKSVSHCGLAIYIIKKYLKAKEELWKLKYFTMQKYNLQKIL